MNDAITIRKDATHTPLLTASLRDRRLSYKARGIYVYLMTFADGDAITTEDLVSASDEDGTAAVRSGLMELRHLGYAELLPRRNEVGQLTGTRWVVYETPQTAENAKNRVSEKPSVRKLHTRKTRLSGKPSVEKTECQKTAFSASQHTDSQTGISSTENSEGGVGTASSRAGVRPSSSTVFSSRENAVEEAGEGGAGGNSDMDLTLESTLNVAGSKLSEQQFRDWIDRTRQAKEAVEKSCRDYSLPLHETIGEFFRRKANRKNFDSFRQVLVYFGYVAGDIAADIAAKRFRFPSQLPTARKQPVGRSKNYFELMLEEEANATPTAA